MVTLKTAFSGFSVPDIAAVKKFYSDTLGLEVKETPEGLELVLGGGNRVFVYLSEKNKPADFTVLNFIVEDIEKAVDDLTTKGVSMEQYNMPPHVVTDKKGIARGDGGVGPRAIAWFKDPAGNIFSIIEE